MGAATAAVPASGAHPMDATPAFEHCNPDLLAALPKDARRLVEVGCSSGALAREYRRANPSCHYTGVEVVAEYARYARSHCDAVLELDIETVDEAFLRERLPGDCWIFGDVLEHLRDPWGLLARVRRVIPAGGSVVACIPNAQNWSVQARLCRGAFRYENVGLLDRTHLRWFTRQTIAEMFDGAGFAIVDARARVFDAPKDARILAAIRALAESVGANPDAAARDALPLQYVIRAVPA